MPNLVFLSGANVQLLKINNYFDPYLLLKAQFCHFPLPEWHHLDLFFLPSKAIFCCDLIDIFRSGKLEIGSKASNAKLCPSPLTIISPLFSSSPKPIGAFQVRIGRSRSRTLSTLPSSNKTLSAVVAMNEPRYLQ